MAHAVVVLAVVVALVSCSDDDSEDVTPRPTVPDLVASCGSVEFPTVPVDIDDLPLLDVSVGEIDWSTVESFAAFPQAMEWFVVERSASTLKLYGRAAAPDAPREQGYAAFIREGERWVSGGGGFGGCRIAVTARGRHQASFVLAEEPQSDDETIRVKSTEVACASGQGPGQRDVDSYIVTEDDASVSILIVVDPLHDELVTCQGNPSFEYVVELGERLGDRTVLDASAHPALERPWPPTETSVESQGRDE